MKCLKLYVCFVFNCKKKKKKNTGTTEEDKSVFFRYSTMKYRKLDLRYYPVFTECDLVRCKMPGNPHGVYENCPKPVWDAPILPVEVATGIVSAIAVVFIVIILQLQQLKLYYCDG